MTLMHYLCKVNCYFLRFCSFLDVLLDEEKYSLMDSLQILAEKMPEVLDFAKDFSSLEPATKVPLTSHVQFLRTSVRKILNCAYLLNFDTDSTEVFG